MLKRIFLYCGVILGISAAKGQAVHAVLTGANVFKKPYNTAPVNSNANISHSMLISPSFYSEHLPFFCRQEINIEHITKFPVKFRLGSVQYVDYLERKPGASLIAP